MGVYQKRTIGRIMMRRDRFTLLELLVVMAIIGILAGMLLPTLNQSRESARSANCIGNLKQVGNSFAMYANDYEEWLPETYCASSGKTWVQTLCEAGYPSCTFAAASGSISAGGADGGKRTIFWCPTDKRNPVEGDADSEGVSYPINSTITSSTLTGCQWMKTNRLKNPSDTMQAIDAFKDNYESGNLYWLEADTDLDLIDYRHNDSTGCLFVGGNVSRLRRGAVPSDPTDIFWGRDL
jgi:prepilin-type N-terminal cleavage/methylation domain-containing protein